MGRPVFCSVTVTISFVEDSAGRAISQQIAGIRSRTGIIDKCCWDLILGRTTEQVGPVHIYTGYCDNPLLVSLCVVCYLANINDLIACRQTDSAQVSNAIGLHKKAAPRLDIRSSIASGKVDFLAGYVANVYRLSSLPMYNSLMVAR
jgi:hypothetical protein